MPSKPAIRAFFDEPTNTVSYLVADPETKRAAVIDPVLDYDHASGKASTKSADVILAAAIGCSRPTPMPTICQGRLTSSSRPAPRSGSASTSATCRRSSGRCSMPPT